MLGYLANKCTCLVLSSSRKKLSCFAISFMMCNYSFEAEQTNRIEFECESFHRYVCVCVLGTELIGV